MTRREFLSIVPAAWLRTPAPPPVIVPVHLVMDSDAKISPEQFQRFWWSIWPEALRDLGRCGIKLDTSVKTGNIWRPASRQPVVTGLDYGVINLVITDRIPIEWDNGRMLSGVTTLYRGFHLCMVGLRRAHGNQIPLLSVNTCLHELLHALMGDIFENRPAGLSGQARELRIDWCATRLWLTYSEAAVRESARRYVQRLRATVPREH
jgi:hypothetical protein